MKIIKIRKEKIIKYKILNKFNKYIYNYLNFNLKNN